MDTLSGLCMDTQPGPVLHLYGHEEAQVSDIVCAVYGHGPTLSAVPSPNPEHTPVRSIRVGDKRWDRLGEEYGARNRSAVLNEVIAWLLREPGAKLPKRIDPPA